jgi:large subunit ribosomal protein L5e
VKRFPGYSAGEKGEYDAKVHQARIMGKHVAEYMKSMAEEDEEAFKAHFAEYLKHGINADKVEAMYKKAHAAIRAKPDIVKKPTKDVNNERVGKTIKTVNGNSYIRPKRLNVKQRKARVMEKIRNAQNRLAAAADQE